MIMMLTSDYTNASTSEFPSKSNWTKQNPTTHKNADRHHQGYFLRQAKRRKIKQQTANMLKGVLADNTTLYECGEPGSAAGSLATIRNMYQQ